MTSLSVLRFYTGWNVTQRAVLKCYAMSSNKLNNMNRMVTTTTANSNVQSSEDYFAKNERLKRPMSPHLTIYKPQITSMLSITHRGTGVMLSSLMTGFSIGMLTLSQSFPHYLGVIESMHFGSSLIFLAKFSLSFPFLFHLFNGVRHLVWDLGYGFSLKTLYQSGYLVLGTSIAAAIVVSL